MLLSKEWRRGVINGKRMKSLVVRLREQIILSRKNLNRGFQVRMDSFCHHQMKLNHENICLDKGGVDNNENMETEKQADEAGTKITKVQELK